MTFRPYDSNEFVPDLIDAIEVRLRAEAVKAPEPDVIEAEDLLPLPEYERGAHPRLYAVIIN